MKDVMAEHVILFRIGLIMNFLMMAVSPIKKKDGAADG